MQIKAVMTTCPECQHLATEDDWFMGRCASCDSPTKRYKDVLFLNTAEWQKWQDIQYSKPVPPRELSALINVLVRWFRWITRSTIVCVGIGVITGHWATLWLLGLPILTLAVTVALATMNTAKHEHHQRALRKWRHRQSKFLRSLYLYTYDRSWDEVQCEQDT